LQKKQDQFNPLKTSKSFVSQSRESYGESPAKRTLPSLKSSRSSSFTRPHIRRLAAVKFQHLSIISKRFSLIRVSQYLNTTMVKPSSRLTSMKPKKRNDSSHSNIERL